VEFYGGGGSQTVTARRSGSSPSAVESDPDTERR
jgi:hypothetical protein